MATVNVQRTGTNCSKYKRSVSKAFRLGIRWLLDSYSINYSGSATALENSVFGKRGSCKDYCRKMKGFATFLLDRMNEVGEGPHWRDSLVRNYADEPAIKLFIQNITTPGHKRAGTRIDKSKVIGLGVDGQLLFGRRKRSERRNTSRRHSLTVAAALVSLKKMTPDPCKCMTADIEEKTVDLLTSSEDREEVNAESIWSYMSEFVFNKSCKFVDLEQKVNGFTLGLGACRESGRSSGGSFGMSGSIGKELWLEAYSSPEGLIKLNSHPLIRDVKDRPECEFRVVVSGGKARGITVNSVNHQILSPLHDLIYDTISSQEWLLRGDATEERFVAFQKFGLGEGEMLVSGDYTSATDNLKIDVAEELLVCFCYKYNLWARSLGRMQIPYWILEFARRSLRVTILKKDGSAHLHTKGQLMGSLLSFPLLCLQNHFAFKSLVPRPVPVKINGDDIVTVLTEQEYTKWSLGVQAYGLELSPGKTFKDKSFFSLNSTYFFLRRGVVELLPVIRLGMMRSVPIGDLGGCFRKWVEIARGNNLLRKNLISVFLDRHLKLLETYDKVSLTRTFPNGIGLDLKKSDFLDCPKLLRRELFSRNFDAHLLNPLSRNNFGTPKGFRWDLVSDPGTKMEWQTVVDSHWKQEFKKLSKERLDAWESSNLHRNTSSRTYIDGSSGSPSYEVNLRENFGRRHLLGPAGVRIDGPALNGESHFTAEADTIFARSLRFQRLETLWRDIEKDVESRAGKRYRRLVPEKKMFEGYEKEQVQAGQIPDFIDIFEEDFLDDLKKKVNETKSRGFHVELAPDEKVSLFGLDATWGFGLESDNDRYCVCGELIVSNSGKLSRLRCKSCLQGEYE